MMRAQYPAPGFRSNNTTSGLTSIGRGEWNWSSTITSTNAYYLVFHYSQIIPSGAYYRSLGFQVRCLRE